ncbi:MAG: oxaloacetate decarboxylase [Pirellulaceae bacterium]|nr:oxaloacetate decarboxylase [Pirellulaceae bacterium]
MPHAGVQAILDEVGTLVFPGVYDCLSARIVQDVGFPMSFVSGYGVSATSLGEPDMGLMTQTEMLERARRICGSVQIPILVDADTGYGNAMNVYRTVSDLIDAGAAGCFLEDQVWPKRCGHMQGKRVIERSEYADKIAAAVEARGDRPFFIVARTDAVAVIGFEEALHRVEDAVEAGADASFIEAPVTRDQLAQIGREAPKPTVANMIEAGKTPLMTREELSEHGFQLVLYPLSSLFSAAHAIREACQQIRDQQSTSALHSRMMTFGDFNSLIGLDGRHQLAKRLDSSR